MLLEVAKHLELEDTQFGSRRERGCHDACAVLYEFLKANSGFCTALLSMDVEGGFDRIDMDLMADFLVARGCPIMFVSWIRHWAGQRRIRFSFNSGLSRMCHLSKGIPQGSLFRPFCSVYMWQIYFDRGFDIHLSLGRLLSVTWMTVELWWLANLH